MTSIAKINPDALAAPPQGLHAHVVVTPPGARLAFIAGQVALDAKAEVVGSDHRTQAAQCFRNVRSCLEALGAGADQIVQMTIIVIDYRPDLFEDINAAGREAFDDRWPATATTLIGAAALGHGAFLVEVNAVAALYD